MPTMEVDFDVYCALCGAGLCGNTTVTQGKYRAKLEIDPCEVCLTKANQEGFQDGKYEANQEDQ